MQLLKVEDNSSIIFELTLNNQKFEFPSKVIGRDKGYLLTEPIRINGKVLSFRPEEKVAINLILVRNEKSPVVWKAIGLAVVSSQGKSMYKVGASSEGFEMNRRGAYRLFVGIGGVAQVGANRKALDVIVKDVSDSGFSFVAMEELDKVEGTPIRLVFADINMNFSLMGIVVRKVILDEKKILYGCQLSVPNSNLQRYINEKQRQLLSINRNNSVYKEKEMLENALKEPGIHETEDDADYKNKGFKNDGTYKKRNINTVGKTERRDIFKDNSFGKKV